jgi:hypothetical protein
LPSLTARAKARAEASVRAAQVRAGLLAAYGVGHARAAARTEDPRYIGHYADEAALPTAGVRDGDWATYTRADEDVTGLRGALRVGGAWRSGVVEDRGPFATRETDDSGDIALQSRHEGDVGWRFVITTDGVLTWSSADDPIDWAVALEPVTTPNFAAGASLVTLGGIGAGAFAREDDDDHFILWGTGSPEGVVSASKGSVYLRMDGDVGTTLYLKQSGTETTTGWTRLPWFPLELLDAVAGTDAFLEARVAGDTFVRYRMSANGNELLGGDGTALPAVRRVVGAGSPEGVVTAGVGSTYQRSDGGAGTCFYVKESGSGNTGWVAK